MNEIDKYVLVEYDIRNGDPASEPLTSPLVIGRMCEELKSAYPTMGMDEAVKTVGMNKFVYDTPEIETLGESVDGMAWGDWLEVGRDKQYPDQRLYLVKVVDREIESLGGGGW